MREATLPDVLFESVCRHLSSTDCASLRRVSVECKRAFDATSFGRFFTFMKNWTFPPRSDLSDVLHGVCLYDDPFFLDWMGGQHDELYDSEYFATAASFKRRKAMTWFRERGVRGEAVVAREAARKGHIDVLTWARENECVFDGTVAEMALESDRLDLFFWLMDGPLRCPVDWRSVRKAACKGFVDVLNALKIRGFEMNDEAAVYGAARHGHEKVVEWFARETVFHESFLGAICDAIQDQSLEALKMLRRHRFVRGEEEEIFFCKLAAHAGLRDFLQWAVQEGFRKDAWACANAADIQNITLLGWLRDAGFPWDEKTWAAAAKQGNLDVMEWIIDRDDAPPFSALTVKWAEWSGHDEAVKWLLDKGATA